MNQTYYIALIATLAEQLYGQPVVFDTQSGQLLRYDKNEDVYYPIAENSDTPTPVWHYDKKRLLPVKLLLSENNGHFQENFGQNTDFFQQNNRNFSNQRAKAKRENIEKNSSNESEIFENDKIRKAAQTLQYYGLGLFHTLYDGQISKTALKIEIKASEILRNTAKEKTINRTIEDYIKAQKQAQNGNLYGLQNTLERLRGRREQQINIKQNYEKGLRRKRLKKLFKRIKIAFGTLFIITGIALAALPYWKRITNVKTHIQKKQTVYSVIAGSYHNKINALKAAENFPASKILYDQDKQLYRLVVFQTTNTDSAKNFAKTNHYWILKTEKNEY